MSSRLPRAVASLAGRFHDEQGSITGWMLMVPVLMLLLCGFAVDLWLATSVRARLAAIADDAAAAGATALAEDELRGGVAGLDPAEARTRAVQAILAHPDAASVEAHAVGISGGVVTVTLHGRVDLLLLRMVGPTTIPVTVSGAAASAVRTGP